MFFVAWILMSFELSSALDLSLSFPGYQRPSLYFVGLSLFFSKASFLCLRLWDPCSVRNPFRHPTSSFHVDLVFNSFHHRIVIADMSCWNLKLFNHFHGYSYANSLGFMPGFVKLSCIRQLISNYLISSLIFTSLLADGFLFPSN